MPNPKIYRQDGKTYTKFPGRDGILVAKNDQEEKLPEVGRSAKQSKVIPADPDAVVGAVVARKYASSGKPTIQQLAMRTKRRGVAETLIAK